jgi:ParB family transcriptional regulator, chromosome partitioning protein
MARRSGLGRGLSSLIPDADGVSAEAGVGDLTMIPVDQVAPNPNQPRVHFDEAALADLADSIAQIGVLQPVLVRRVDDAFQLIAGERRWRAARRAGLTEIPAIVRDSDDVAAVEEALVENLHRADLTALEEAAAYLQLIEDFHLTHDDVAKRVGKSRSAVSNTLRLMGLPPEVQRLLADGKLSAGHARALLGTADRALQEQLADKVVGDGWSVRAVEDAVRRGSLGERTSAPEGGRTPRASDGAGLAAGTRLRPPGLLELEELLADHLDTRVNVQMGAKRGRVTVEFADLEDLERIYRRIVGGS